jgi:hypothetical protein
MLLQARQRCLLELLNLVAALLPLIDGGAGVPQLFVDDGKAALLSLLDELGDTLELVQRSKIDGGQQRQFPLVFAIRKASCSQPSLTRANFSGADDIPILP